MRLSTEYQNLPLLELFWDLINKNEFTDVVIFEILHNINNQASMSTCLNYANLNVDKEIALKILDFEIEVHKNDMSVLRCIRDSLQNEQLKVWLVNRLNKKEDSDCLKKRFKIDKTKKPWIVFSLFLETFLLSILPYTMDLASDYKLFKTYSIMSNGNNCNTISFGILQKDKTHDCTETYRIAKRITQFILIANGLTFFLGCWFSYPNWVNTTINELDEKIKRRKRLENDQKTHELYDNEKKELEELIKEYPKLESINRKKYCYYFLLPFALMFWPIFVLIPHQYLSNTAKVKSYLSQERYKSENLWFFIKTFESSIESGVQIALQMWLLLPIFGLLSHWSWTEMVSSGLRGVLNILSFGIFEPDILDISLGKILFTLITFSFGHAMARIKKPGLGVGAKLKVFPLIFISIIAQVTARFYTIRNLMLIEVSGLTKYYFFSLGHFISILAFKLIFETRSKKKENKGFIHKLKRIVLIIFSCCSSIILIVDLHWTSSKLKYSKFNLISQCLFFLLVFCENLLLTILPFIAPTLFPSKSNFNHSSFTGALIVVTTAWIISVGLEVILWPLCYSNIYTLQEKFYNFHFVYT